MFSASSPVALGNLATFVTNGGNHSPETWANMCIHRLLSISDTAPQPIRDQAHAFAQAMRNVLAAKFDEALRMEREAMAAKLEREGQTAAAIILRSI